ncbi:MAG: hypothetical protein ACI4UK_09620 [Floccifex sp.]
MKKAELKNKVKGFVKKNSHLIVAGIMGGAAFYIGMKCGESSMKEEMEEACKKKLNEIIRDGICIDNEEFKDFIRGLKESMPNDFTVFWNTVEEGVKPEQLGPVGEKMVPYIEEGEDVILTHFLSFGPGRVGKVTE